MEFMKHLEMLRAHDDFNTRMKYPMMSIWANHLIHRIDDTSHFTVGAPHGNIEYPFTLKTRTKWSKNVKRMKQCPDQIILASEDWRTCAILWYAIYLELWLRKHPTAKLLFSTNLNEKKGAIQAKTNYHNRISKVVWDKQEFKDPHDETGDTAEKGLGKHSLRKYATERSKRKGSGVQR